MTGLPDPGAAQLAFQAGDFARARELALDCLREAPDSLQARSVLANACNALGDFAQAAAALEALHTALPREAGIRKALAMAYNNLGSQSFHSGDIDAAALLYERSIGLDDSNILAYSNLAACAEKRRHQSLALEAWQCVLALDPAHTQAALGCAHALRALGREREADAALDALAARPLAPEPSLALALEFERIGAAARAATVVASAGLECNLDACAQLAAMQKLCGNLAGARRNFGLLAESARRGGDLRAEFRAERDAALAIATIFASRADIGSQRDAYAERLDRLIKAWPPQRLGQIDAQLEDLKCPRFGIAYQGGNDLELATRYGDWLGACAARLLPAAGTDPPMRPIRRIGLVGARWTQGTVAAYFGTWIGALRAHGAEVYLYTLPAPSDRISQSLAAQADHAVRLSAMLAAAATELREAGLDLLIYPEVGLDAGCEVLASLRLAPRQWAAWGQPETTGLSSIDRFISVAAMEPPNAAAHYRETLVLLPGIGTRYARPPRVASAPRHDLGLPAGPLYTLPHALAKLHPDIDELLIEIARRDRDARFVFVADEVPALTRALRTRIDSRLRAADLDAGLHCHWLPRLPIDAFRRLLASSDVILDSIHFSGGNTSLDALAQGTPIVTIEGAMMRGRQTAAMLRILDGPDTIAPDITRAAIVAADLVHSPDRRADLAARLEANADRLFERTEALDALGAAIAD